VRITRVRAHIHQLIAEAIMSHPGPIRRGTVAVAVAVALAALGACGGEKQSTDSAAAKAAATSNAPTAAPAATPSTTPSAAPAATPSPSPAAAPAAATGATHDVQMLGDASGYRFNPVSLTIKRGDAVRWTNVSGGPHNATFWPDSIPAGAQAPLTANMPGQTMPLTGPLLLTPNQTYTISFANVPPGTYKYYCTPHLALGMKGVIQVQ
jgi:plastocyanin